MLLDFSLEGIVMGGDDPARVLGCFNKLDRNRITRAPELHRIVIDRERAAQDCGAEIGDIAVSPNDFKDCPAAGFIIAMQDMLHTGNVSSGCRAEQKRLTHWGSFALLDRVSEQGARCDIPRLAPPWGDPLADGVEGWERASSRARNNAAPWGHVMAESIY